MVNSIDVKKGMVIKLDGELYSVSFSQFVNPGKGSAFVRTKLKNVKRGNVIERTFKSAEKVEDVELEKRYMTYLYRDGDNFVFMDRDDFEQFSISLEMIEDIVPFMKEEMPVEITFYEGNPIGVIPPNFVELQVTYAEEGLKGDTQGTARKRVQLETGGEVQVPLYVGQDDIIKVDLRDFSFVERVSK
ncbi:MAG: elongation factor P [Spirochaetales bacterium]|nr:elongation factor P [Leptospiraceae bacterium]MCP5482918.1 elongation factor P [Spirochaetales bacterium]MCP5484902.1 elongation factor P [Spirochaetales bacterium]